MFIPRLKCAPTLALALAAATAACDQSSSPATDQNTAAETRADGRTPVTMLRFEESEPATGVYPVRMLVSNRRIRIDDGPGSADYILYDDDKKQIFSVVAANRRVLVIAPPPYQPPPADLNLREEKVTDDNIPAAADYHRYYADGVLCRHFVTKPGFLPAAARILANYHKVLAAQQQETARATPAELQTPCFLANYPYAPAASPSGLPIQQWDNTGYRRSLQAFEQDHPVDPALFTLPDYYNYFGVGAAPAEPLPGEKDEGVNRPR